MKKPFQPILGLVAPRPSKPLSASQREMMRRQVVGGRQPSILSPGQQMAARARAGRQERQKPLDDAVSAYLTTEMRRTFVVKRMPSAPVDPHRR